MEPKGSYCVHKSQPIAKPCIICHNFFYGEELFAHGQNLKLEDYPLLAVCNCLFNIFAATLHIWRLSPPSTVLEGGDSLHDMQEYIFIKLL